MVDHLVLDLVIGAAVGFAALLWQLRAILWYLRGTEGIGRALVIKLVIGDAWMLVYLSAILYVRYISHAPLPAWFLIALAVVLFARPWGFLIWFSRWKAHKA